MIVRRIGDSGEEVGPIMGQTYDDLLAAYRAQRKWLWVAGAIAAAGMMGWIITAAVKSRRR